MPNWGYLYQVCRFFGTDQYLAVHLDDPFIHVSFLLIGKPGANFVAFVTHALTVERSARKHNFR
jgi:hypothetical protein